MSWKIQLPHWKIDHFVTKVVFVSFFNVHNTASYLWTCPYPKHPLLFNKVCVYQLFSWCPVNESVTSFSIHFLSFIFLSIPKTTTTYRTRWIDHKLRAMRIGLNYYRPLINHIVSNKLATKKKSSTFKFYKNVEKCFVTNINGDLSWCFVPYVLTKFVFSKRSIRSCESCLLSPGIRLDHGKATFTYLKHSW